MEIQVMELHKMEPQTTEVQTMEPQIAEPSPVWAASLERKKDELATLLQVLEQKRKRKQRDLSYFPVITLDEAIVNSDLESFQFAVETLAQQFADKKVSTLLTKYLYPSLEHAVFFNNIVASITQYEPTARLVWGLLLIVIQVNSEQVQSNHQKLTKSIPSAVAFSRSQ